MIHPIRVSGTDATIGISPLELYQERTLGRWPRFRLWIAALLRRLLPFLFLLVVLHGEDLNPQIPDKLQIRYWQARYELAQVVQEMVSFCHEDVVLSADGKTLACKQSPVTAKPEEKK